MGSGHSRRHSRRDRRRSGSSAVPDESWSSWTDPIADPRGGSLKLPPARYIQWRADLSRLKTEATPILKGVTLTWLQENIAPDVRHVSVSPPGAPRPKGSTAGDPSKEGASMSLWIGWSSSDANGDPLRHTISIRRNDETD